MEWNSWEVGCGGRDEDAVDSFRERFGLGRRKVCRDMISFAMESGAGFWYTAGGGGWN
jgi:hypothetical protein